MLKKDSTTVGLIAGLVFPALAFVISWFFRDSVFIINQPAVPYFAAFALNLVMMRWLNRKGKMNTMKGIIITTLLILIVLFLFKLRLKL